METVLVTFGGVPLLISLGAGTLIKLKGYQVNQGSLKGDRTRATRGVIRLMETNS